MPGPRDTDIGPVDIINVVSVTSQAQVKQWYEENDEEIQNALYWRQAFDVRTYELSVCSWLPLYFSSSPCTNPVFPRPSSSSAAAIPQGIPIRC
jgi:hypothetical protein